jgi:hypothetical protein
MEWDPGFEKTKSFLREVILPLLPYADYGDVEIRSSENRPADSFKGLLRAEKLFQESPYAYGGENRFIHFTSKEGLLGIINSGYIRTSAIQNLGQEHAEFDGLKCFTADHNLRRQLQSKTETIKEVFTLSMCESTPEMQNSGDMWMRYGGNHSGVFLEFSMARENAFRHAVGKVIYDDEHQLLHQLNERIIAFKQAHKFDTNNYPGLFAELLAYHKPSCFSIENEVRWYYRQNPHLKHTIVVGEHPTSENQMRPHSRIFLRNTNDEIPGITPTSIPEDTIPSIYLHRVVLGNNNTADDEARLRVSLRNLTKDKGYRFEVVRRGSD